MAADQNLVKQTVGDDKIYGGWGVNTRYITSHIGLEWGITLSVSVQDDCGTDGNFNPHFPKDLIIRLH